MKSVRDFLHRHPHVGHAVHGALHVVYFVGVAASNLGKFYGITAGILAVIGVVALIRGTDP